MWLLAKVGQRDQTVRSAMEKPSFIGVGPEKTGTTWIYSQLKDHLDVYLTPAKERRYFWVKYHFPN